MRKIFLTLRKLTPTRTDSSSQNITPASNGSGSKIFDPVQVNFLWLGLGQPFMVWVWIWKILPNFSIFCPSGQKKISSERSGSEAGQPLIYCGSKVSSGRVRAHLYTPPTFNSKLFLLNHLLKFFKWCQFMSFFPEVQLLGFSNSQIGW